MPQEISTVNREPLSLEYALCNTTTVIARFVKINWLKETKAGLKEKDAQTQSATLYCGITRRLFLQQLPIETKQSFWSNRSVGLPTGSALSLIHI